MSEETVRPALEWDERGLIKGIEYPVRPDGGIDWRAMIPREHLYVATEYKEEVLKRFGVSSLSEVDTSKVPDHQLRVMLGGWKRLLFLRGYTSLTNPCTFVTPEKAVATCTIMFAPNYETRMREVTYSWTASASYLNTTGDIPQMFLEATACNRAFCLCLRGFLNINIVGKDEIGPAKMKKGVPEPVPEETVPDQQAATLVSAANINKGAGVLAQRCVELGITFERMKEGATARYKAELKSDPATWNSFDDVAPLDAYTLLSKLVKVPAPEPVKPAPKPKKAA